MYWSILMTAKALALANQHRWRSPLWPTLTTQIFPYHHAVMIQDDSGCNIDLHHLALFMCRNVGDDEGLWQRARAATLRGIALYAPSAADEVLISIAHGLLHALSPIADWMLPPTTAKERTVLGGLIRQLARISWYLVLQAICRAKTSSASTNMEAPPLRFKSARLANRWSSSSCMTIRSRQYPK